MTRSEINYRYNHSPKGLAHARARQKDPSYRAARKLRRHSAAGKATRQAYESARPWLSRYFKGLRRARVHGAPVSGDLASIKIVYWCASMLELCDGVERHVHHVVPLSNGGAHSAENMVVLTHVEHRRAHNAGNN